MPAAATKLKDTDEEATNASRTGIIPGVVLIGRATDDGAEKWRGAEVI